MPSEETREYQRELFLRALNENIIIMLGTGSGKTHIAALLAAQHEKDETHDRSQGKPNRHIFCIVPSVQLVKQQAKVFRYFLEYPVGELSGDDTVDHWTAQMWQMALEDHRMIVCTPQILCDGLNKGFLQISDFRLLIVDEAHHCKKNNAMAQIFNSRSFQTTPFKDRPRILGLTASPVDGGSTVCPDFDVEIAALERQTTCKVVTTSNLSLSKTIPKPTEEFWEYLPSARIFNTPLLQQLEPHMRRIELKDLKKAAAGARKCGEDLGVWCGNQALLSLWNREMIAKLERKLDGDDFISSSLMIPVLEQKEAARKCLDIALSTDVDRNPPPDCELSPKVLALRSKLANYFAQHIDSRAIVFVKERSAARAVSQVLKISPGMQNLKVGMLLGVRSPIFGEAAQTWVQQEDTLTKFRHGEINCLVCTSVAEEGLDVPECSLVVMFDGVGTMIQLIQTRGRTRSETSTYAVMVPHGGNDRAIVKFRKECEEYLIATVADLPIENRLILSHDKLSDDQNITRFTTPAGATCNYNNSVQTIEQFCQSLQYEGEFTRPIYVETCNPSTPNSTGYSYRLEITFNPDLVPDQIKNHLLKTTEDMPTVKKFRHEEGETFRSKNIAKRDIAAEACHWFWSLGLLDQNLNSVLKKQVDPNSHTKLPSTEKQHAYQVKIKSDFWSAGCGERPQRLFVTVVTIVLAEAGRPEYDPFALLTRTALPRIDSFVLVLENDIKAEIRLSRCNIPFKINSETLQSLQGFTLKIFKDLFNKVYSSDGIDMRYWLAPVAPRLPNLDDVTQLTEVVDMDLLKTCLHEPDAYSPGTLPESLCNKLYMDPLSGKYRYISHEVVADATVFSPVPSLPNYNGKTDIKNVLRFTMSAGDSRKAVCEQTADASQPVLRATMLSLRRDLLLQPRDDEKAKSSIECHIAPEFLKMSTIPPAFARSMLLWPSTETRLDNTLMAMEFSRKAGFNFIPPALVVAALTLAADKSEDNLAVETPTMKADDINCERLEFFGDTWLKFSSVLSVFIIHFRKDPAIMHDLKKNLISNDHLHLIATSPDLEIDKYIRTGQVDRNLWYPDGLVKVKGRGKFVPNDLIRYTTKERLMAAKSIADVSEALIGAAFLSSKSSANRFDRAIQVVTRLVKSADHDHSSWDEVCAKFQVPKHMLDRDDIRANDLAIKLSPLIGYLFKHPTLCRSALQHRSFRGSRLPPYERYEFLGDGAYDVVVADFLAAKYPNRGPSFLASHKDPMVSNKFLSHIAMELGLVEHITHAIEVRQMDMYDENWRQARKSTASIPSNFWLTLDNAPKMYGDVVEAIMGAMLIDSGFDFTVVERFFNHHIMKWFDDPVRHTEAARDLMAGGGRSRAFDVEQLLMTSGIG